MTSHEAEAPTFEPYQVLRGSPGTSGEVPSDTIYNWQHETPPQTFREQHLAATDRKRRAVYELIASLVSTCYGLSEAHAALPLRGGAIVCGILVGTRSIREYVSSDIELGKIDTAQQFTNRAFEAAINKTTVD